MLFSLKVFIIQNEILTNATYYGGRHMLSEINSRQQNKYCMIMVI